MFLVGLTLLMLHSCSLVGQHKLNANDVSPCLLLFHASGLFFSKKIQRLEQASLREGERREQQRIRMLQQTRNVTVAQ